MHKIARSLAGVLVCGVGFAACTSNPPADADLSGSPDLMALPDLTAPPDLTGAPSPMMSFFIASEKGSGKLDGLAGADARCQRLGASVGLGRRKWAAYLSAFADGGQAAVNARDRIGTGPWYNFAGAKLADNVDALHAADVTAGVTKMSALDERGRTVLGRGDMPNEHDLLTGSTAAGMVNGKSTCANWTSEAATGVVATVGHFDRQGGGAAPTSWNSAHDSSGCSAAALVGTGGAGHIYCFATD